MVTTCIAKKCLIKFVVRHSHACAKRLLIEANLRKHLKLDNYYVFLHVHVYTVIMKFTSFSYH